MISTQRHYAGARGASEMSSEAIVTARTPDSFHASVVSTLIGDLGLARIRTAACVAKNPAGEHRAGAQQAGQQQAGEHQAGQHQANPADRVHFVFVIAGALRCRQDGRDSITPALGATVLRSDTPWVGALSQGADLLIITIPSEQLPLNALGALPRSTASPIEPSVLADTIVGFALPFLEVSTESPRPTDAEQRMLLWLIDSLFMDSHSMDSHSIDSHSIDSHSSGREEKHPGLADTPLPLTPASPLSRPAEAEESGTAESDPAENDPAENDPAEAHPAESGDTELAGHTREVIRRNLGRPGLDAAFVAKQLGVSARSLYRHFELSQTGIAEQIRALRLDKIATQLREPGARPLFERLATDAGFSSVDVCSRAFKARFGVSLGEFWLAEHPTDTAA